MAYSKFITITCRCERKLKILKPQFCFREHGIKSHTHCKPCNLEWHLDLAGKVYAHRWKDVQGRLFSQYKHYA